MTTIKAPDVDLDKWMIPDGHGGFKIRDDAPEDIRRAILDSMKSADITEESDSRFV